MLTSDMGMKRFVIRLLVFLSMMFILDRGFGVAMKYLQEHANGGYVGHHNYILHQSNEDILIFGSSRAIHHYNPQIIEDSLGMSCYNCGQDGNGIVLFYGWWQLIKEHYKPKMIIYDVTPGYDLLMGDSNSTYLGWLRSEYENEEIKRVFEDIDVNEKYKMMSMMYRYNSKFLQNITDYIHPLFQISKNGYLPLKGELNKMKIKNRKNKEVTIDSLKLKYIVKLMNQAKADDVKIVFVASPMWYGMKKDKLTPVEELCSSNGVEFYDFSNDAEFVHNDNMFKDGTHLNAQGAETFTKKLCEIIIK